jgi:hypothetical protein
MEIIVYIVVALWLLNKLGKWFGRGHYDSPDFWRGKGRWKD